MEDVHISRTGRYAENGQFGDPVLDLGASVIAVFDDTVVTEDGSGDRTRIRAERNDILLDADLTGRTHEIGVGVEGVEFVADKFLVRFVPNLDTADGLVVDDLICAGNALERGLDGIVGSGSGDSGGGSLRSVGDTCGNQERRSDGVAESDLPLAVLHILEEGGLLHLDGDSTTIQFVAEIANAGLDIVDRVGSITLFGLIVVGKPTGSAGESGNVSGRNLCGEGDVLDTARVIGIGKGDSASGFHLADLIGDRPDMSILNLGEAAEEELREVVVDALARGLIHKGRSNIEVLQHDQFLAVVVLAENPAGFLARDGAGEGVEALRTDRNRLGVEVDIGCHHLDLIFGLKHLVVEVNLRGVPFLKTDFVEVLALATRENLKVVSHKGLGRSDAIRGHQRVQSKILIHCSYSFTRVMLER